MRPGDQRMCDTRPGSARCRRGCSAEDGVTAPRDRSRRYGPSTGAGRRAVSPASQVISIREPGVADKGAGGTGEGQEVAGFALVAPVHRLESVPLRAIRRRSRRPERGGRQLLPRAARRGHEHDRGQHLPAPVSTSSTALPTGRRLRHHPPEHLPQLIRHQRLGDPHTGRLSNTPSEMTCREATEIVSTSSGPTREGSCHKIHAAPPTACRPPVTGHRSPVTGIVTGTSVRRLTGLPCVRGPERGHRRRFGCRCHREG